MTFRTLARVLGEPHEESALPVGREADSTRSGVIAAVKTHQ